MEGWTRLRYKVQKTQTLTEAWNADGAPIAQGVWDRGNALSECVRAPVTSRADVFFFFFKVLTISTRPLAGKVGHKTKAQTRGGSPLSARRERSAASAKREWKRFLVQGTTDCSTFVAVLGEAAVTRNRRTSGAQPLLAFPAGRADVRPPARCGSDVSFVGPVKWRPSGRRWTRGTKWRFPPSSRSRSRLCSSVAVGAFSGGRLRAAVRVRGSSRERDAGTRATRASGRP